MTKFAPFNQQKKFRFEGKLSYPWNDERNLPFQDPNSILEELYQFMRKHKFYKINVELVNVDMFNEEEMEEELK